MHLARDVVMANPEIRLARFLREPTSLCVGVVP